MNQFEESIGGLRGGDVGRWGGRQRTLVPPARPLLHVANHADYFPLSVADRNVPPYGIAPVQVGLKK